MFAELVRFPRIGDQLGADCACTPLANTGPGATRVPHVLTIHDLIPFRIHTLRRSSEAVLKRVVTRSARVTRPRSWRSRMPRARTSKRDARSRARARAHRPQRAWPPAARPARTWAGEVRARLGLSSADRIVISVAAFRRHKNQEVLVARARAAARGCVVLVLCGPEEPYLDELLRLALQLGVAARVRFAGYQPDDVLEGLWGFAGCAARPVARGGLRRTRPRGTRSWGAARVLGHRCAAGGRWRPSAHFRAARPGGGRGGGDRRARGPPHTRSGPRVGG